MALFPFFRAPIVPSSEMVEESRFGEEDELRVPTEKDDADFLVQSFTQGKNGAKKEGLMGLDVSISVKGCRSTTGLWQLGTAVAGVGVGTTNRDR